MLLHFQSVLSPCVYQLVHRPRTFPSRGANRGHHHRDATYTGGGGDDAPVEVREMEATEAAELFQKCAKLKSPGPDVNTEMLRIVVKVGKLALAITPAGPYITATPRLRSDIRLYLPEYRERRKQLLSMKAKKLIHRYGESVLSMWETSFAVVARQSGMAARLLSLLGFLSFGDIFPALFEGSAGEWQSV